jgi:hypothetical protein
MPKENSPFERGAEGKSDGRGVSIEAMNIPLTALKRGTEKAYPERCRNKFGMTWKIPLSRVE